MGGGRVGDVMRSVGLERVDVRRLTMPCGKSGGRLGNMLALDWISVLKGIGGMTVAQGVTTAAQFDQVIEQARAELASPTLACVMPLYIAYGQRAR